MRRRRSRLLVEVMEPRVLLSSYMVTTTADGGTGSLRAAIDAANANPGADSISFDASLVGQKILLNGSELPVITHDLTITGLGADQFTIDAQGQSRIFQINPGATVEISGLTLTGGSLSGAGKSGGAIRNAGVLTIAVSRISGNSVKNASGGGIWNQGTLTITDSTISDNSADHAGGGIISVGNLTIIDSTISGNSANTDGGGMWSSGGTVTNSTICGNLATLSGGGIYTFGSLAMTNSTLIANRADSEGTGQTSDIGGGLLLYMFARGTLNNNIIAGNFRGIGTTADDVRSLLSGKINISNHNLIGDAATSGGITNGVNGNIVGVSDLTTVFVDVNHDGKIDASDLADNGGPTETYALAATSPAINAGDNSLAVDANGNPLQFDQRSEGFDRIVAGTVDIGAFEVQTLAPEELVKLINGTIQDLFASGVIDRGQQEALTLTRRDNSGDAGKVQALLNETEAFVLGDVLTQQQANDLLDLGNVLLLELARI